MTVRELQDKAKEIATQNPNESLDILKQALELDPTNKYTISAYGRISRFAGKPKDFIDFCSECEESVLKDTYIQSALCWCLYDYWIKSFDIVNIEQTELLFKTAEQITANCKQLNANECFKNPYVLTINKVVKILDKLESEDYDRQLEWMKKINPENLPDTLDTKTNNDGSTQQYLSQKEQYFNQMCWIYYKQNIRTYSEEDSTDGFDDFIQAAEYIVQNCIQKLSDDKSNPFVITVLKVVKIYNRRNCKNYTKILEWLSKLNPDNLSEEVFNFQDSQGKERELASPKEQYFQYISKAYEKLRKYQECVAACDAGMEKIGRWHYRNHVWMRARRYYCACMTTDDFDTAIKEYVKLAEREKHWFMYHKISILFLNNNQIDTALLYAAKAYFATKSLDMEKMVNLIFDIGILLQAKSKILQAKVFFQACAYYRNFREWTLSEELKFMIADSDLDIQKKYNEQQLKIIIQEYLPKSSESQTKDGSLHYGKIRNIMPYGDGFIERQHNAPIYFKAKENKTFQQNDQVAFEIGTDNQERPIAFNLRKQRRIE